MSLFDGFENIVKTVFEETVKVVEAGADVVCTKAVEQIVVNYSKQLGHNAVDFVSQEKEVESIIAVLSTVLSRINPAFAIGTALADILANVIQAFLKEHGKPLVDFSVDESMKLAEKICEAITNHK
jgi:hypothetical protein